MRLSFLTVLDISTKKNPTESRTYLTTDSDVSEENRQKGNVSEKWGFQPESREQDLSCWSFAINTKFTSRETKCLSRKTKTVDVGLHVLRRHGLGTRCQERFNTWLLRLRLARDDLGRCRGRTYVRSSPVIFERLVTLPLGGSYNSGVISELKQSTILREKRCSS